MALVLTRPGDARAVHLVWSVPDWTFVEWYVNLQEPLERTGTGVRMNDQLLDIVVLPDLSWWWKDEDHLARAVADGRKSRLEADAIRAEGERAIEDVEARRWPFDGSYDAWRPDQAWDMPVIPEEWKLEA